MGLDMYACKTKANLAGAVDFDLPDYDEEENHLFYWRKHPNLHGWMHRLYEAKGGTQPDFNVTPVLVTKDDLDQLEHDVREAALPETSGFFFGQSSPEDRDNDLEFIRLAREAIAEGYKVFYYAWW
jgi:hypothetical protein